MLWADLTLPVMIVLSGIALALGFPTENLHKNCLLVAVGLCDSQLLKENSSCPLCKSWNTRQKNKACRFMEPIIIKLDNVIAKYEDKEIEIEKFYSSISKLNLRNNIKSRRFGCLNFRRLKIKISELTDEIRKIDKNFQFLIDLEMSSVAKKHREHEGRLILLTEFHAEIKNLLYELKHNKKMKNERRKKSLKHRKPKTEAPANLSRMSSTKLMVKEYELLNESKTLLENWSGNLKSFYLCAVRSC